MLNRPLRLLSTAALIGIDMYEVRLQKYKADRAARGQSYDGRNNHKNAPSEVRGYRTLQDAFVFRPPGGCKVKIVSFRSVDMDVFNFVS